MDMISHGWSTRGQLWLILGDGVNQAADLALELRYMRDVADDRGLDWEYTERVLSSRDLDEWMRQGW
jgi:hypothetical protein